MEYKEPGKIISIPISSRYPTAQEWSEAAKASILPICCNGTNGLLYKEKFGSGGKGKCINFDEIIWCTPMEFESICGRGQVKGSWEREIIFGRRNLQTLIRKGYLILHSTDCVCSICTNDPNATSPIQLFQPDSRNRKRKNQDINEDTNGRKQIVSSDIGTSSTIPGVSSSINSLNQNSMTCNDGLPSFSQDNRKIIEDAMDNVVKTSAPLKSLVQEIKEKSNQEIQNLTSQLQNSTQTTIVILPVDNYPKEFQFFETNSFPTDSMELPLSNKLCVNCNQRGDFICSGCLQVNYCSTFCKNKDWPNHQVKCQEKCEQITHLVMN